MRARLVIGAAVVAAAAAAVVGVGTAMGSNSAGSADRVTQDPGYLTQDPGDDEPEQPDAPLSGTALERATRAALEHTGGGNVTETETGDDGAAYGVEVRTPDGRHVEVELDRDFAVVGEEADDGDED